MTIKSFLVIEYIEYSHKSHISKRKCDATGTNGEFNKKKTNENDEDSSARIIAPIPIHSLIVS